MRNFRNYEVWNNAIEFCSSIYSLTDSFPKQERFGLISQMQRSAVSIPSNIAEGCSRKSETEFKRFIEISIGSAFELETQLIIAFKVGYVNEKQFKSSIDTLQLIERQLNGLRNRLK